MIRKLVKLNFSRVRILFLSLFILSAFSIYSTDSPLVHPAEFERVASVMIAAPLNIPFNLIVEMSKTVKVIVIANSENRVELLNKRLTGAGANMSNIEYLREPTDKYWTRDYGPWLVFNKDNISSRVVNYIYNRSRPLDDKIAEAYAKLHKLSFVKIPVAHTGGNYMTDGYGIAISTTLTLKENPHLKLEEIESLFAKEMGIKKYHFVEDVNGDYIEHIDCWAKLLSPDTILIRSVPKTHKYYKQIEDAANYFKEQTSSYGSKYKVVRIFTPSNEPYTNSLIVNNKVFVPLKKNPNDKAAIETYKKAMPGYEIFGYDNEKWYSTDALHCRTKEIPDHELLYIEHSPVQIVKQDDTLEIPFKVIPFSKKPVKTEVTGVYWRNNPKAAWTFTKATLSQDGNFVATLPKDKSKTVDYYIYTEDESGRKESKPFIGAAWPITVSVK